MEASKDIVGMSEVQLVVELNYLISHIKRPTGNCESDQKKDQKETYIEGQKVVELLNSTEINSTGKDKVLNNFARLPKLNIKFLVTK